MAAFHTIPAVTLSVVLEPLSSEVRFPGFRNVGCERFRDFYYGGEHPPRAPAQLPFPLYCLIFPVNPCEIPLE